jgi:hypothetical protein
MRHPCRAAPTVPAGGGHRAGQLAVQAIHAVVGYVPRRSIRSVRLQVFFTRLFVESAVHGRGGRAFSLAVGVFVLVFIQAD